jgi:capsid portal protein
MTDEHLHYIERVITVLALGTTLFLTMALYGNVRVNPAQVKTEVMTNRDLALTHYEQIKNELAGVRRDLAKVEAVAVALAADLPRRTADKIYRKDLERWLEEFRRANAERDEPIDVPDLPALMDAMDFGK